VSECTGIVHIKKPLLSTDLYSAETLAAESTGIVHNMKPLTFYRQKTLSVPWLSAIPYYCTQPVPD
jgi:hypothetical protein